MKKLITSTALATALLLAPYNAVNASELSPKDKVKEWCSQNGIATAVCIGGIVAIMIAVASRDQGLAEAYSNNDTGPIGSVSGNGSPETRTPDPTPDYSLNTPDVPQDIHEQGCLWGSRATGTC